MPTLVVGAYVQLTGVAFENAAGDAVAPGSVGSFLRWSNTGLSDDATSTIADQGIEGALEAGGDTWAGVFQFSGYTVDIGAAIYPVYSDGLTYFVVTDTAANDAIAPSGLSREWAAQVSEVYMCFAAGTQIATPAGPRAVETLVEGDLVSLHSGGTAPVRWLGRQTLAPRRGLAPDLRLVRIEADAFGPGRPATDLTLTADHALFLEGALITAGALVGLPGVRPDTAGMKAARVTVYHVECDRHALLIANGLPAESFIDYVGRSGFDNHAAYLARYGNERAIPEMALPRITTSRHLPPALRAGRRAIA